MPESTLSRLSSGRKELASFTIVELLTVIFIIALLCALTLGAFSGVQNNAARSRARSEVQAMGAALEGYKTDNGSYPISDGSLLLTNTYASYDGTSMQYQTNAQILYRALSGQTNFTDNPVNKSYMAFKRNQVGDPSGTATGATYLQDPWGYAYGYNSGTTNGASSPSYPYSGQNGYDLWSTAGLLAGKVNTNTWIQNWGQ